ncbi:substrate-binding protein [Caldovatus sediminis]|uniref:Substrate-binding protein n=1 Tax=Caldovatus sediminis TaxID=2041189 RepID=A0A8J2Z8N9_9PROT|nr:ABC transporter substrate-binding protein [Caldovatus sediminis]GGG20900.1 substrate-binding protein [Caldovatus sediminis]
MTLTRRSAIAIGAAAALAAPRVAPAQAQARTLRFVPQANLANIDPVWSTAVVVRNHGLMIYDTLFGLGADLRPRPQMAAGHEVSADGLRWTIALRPGLRFHDGERVRARDCVASIARWAKRDVLGQRLDALLEEMRALDDDRFEIRLKRPWPGLAFALGKPSANICAIMPERVARTDPFQQIQDYTGSGPFRFRQDLFRPGDIVVYERFADYVPREEPPDLLAGGKRVHFDRVEWRVVPDPSTAAAALQNNEVDWWETPLADLLPVLRRHRDIVVERINDFGNLGVLRFNFLHPPFDNPAVRRALLPAIDQRAFMQAAMGTDAALWRVPAGVFTPGTPLANDAGIEVLTRPRDLEAARRMLREAGYRGERVVMLSATDLPVLQSLAEVAADLMRRVGFNVDLQAMDWGTHIQRRTNRGPVDQGGWSAFCTTWEGLDVSVPGSHQPIRGHGAAAWAGWPTIPKLEELREAWFQAADIEAEKRIAEEIQRVVWQEVPFIPLGQVLPVQAYRRSLTGVLKGSSSMFWGVRRA